MEETDKLQESEDNCVGSPFKSGFDERRNLNGRPPDTQEKKIIKKAIKELIQEYREGLADALPSISPILIAKALDGDLGSIKEINDRVLGKPDQKSDITTNGKELPILVRFIDKPDERNNNTD